MSVSDILKSAGFVSALVIDDAFDDVPIAADLAIDEEAWTIFVDDVRTEQELVVEAFPAYATMNANELRASDEFVKTIWDLKGKLSDELWMRLFETYERENTSDREFLQKLKNRLSAAGLEVKSAGRTVPEDAHGCSIIFADLFLGAAQQDFDVDKSIRRLDELMARRENSPPAVVLMSRSPRLQDKKERFRDDAKMVGALFRVYRKQELLEGSTVETVLERLATHRSVRRRSSTRSILRNTPRPTSPDRPICKILSLGLYGKMLSGLKSRATPLGCPSASATCLSVVRGSTPQPLLQCWWITRMSWLFSHPRVTWCETPTSGVCFSSAAR